MSDSLDLDSLRLSQDFGHLTGVKKILLACPLRKPRKHEWVKTHPDWSFPAAVLKLQGERKDDLYLLHQSMTPAVPFDCIPTMFVPTITRQEVLYHVAPAAAGG